MTKRRLIFLAAATAALVALLAGGWLMLAYGFTPPPWLLTVELAVGSAVALLCGFFACLSAFRALLPWFRLRPVKGATLVILGIAAMYVPPQFIASAVFLALGVKLVWTEACELAKAEQHSELAPAKAGASVICEGCELVADDPASAFPATPRKLTRQPVRRDTAPAWPGGGQ